MLKSKRIDMPDGSILWRNIYHVHQPDLDGRVWRGLARVNKQYTWVETYSSQFGLQGATWKTVKTS